LASFPARPPPPSKPLLFHTGDDKTHLRARDVFVRGVGMRARSRHGAEEEGRRRPKHLLLHALAVVAGDVLRRLGRCASDDECFLRSSICGLAGGGIFADVHWTLDWDFLLRGTLLKARLHGAGVRRGRSAVIQWI